MVQEARRLLQHGINPIAIGNNKQALYAWGQLQNELTSVDALPDMFERASAIATINGQVSGGLMVLDFEGQSHGVDCLFEPWLEGLQSESKSLTDKLIYHTTGGGGYHVRFRCPDGVRASQDLAKTVDNRILVELKGEGGYTLCPPSTGYQWVVGNWDALPTITVQELESLLHSCRQLDQLSTEPKTRSEHQTVSDPLWDSYNQSQEWRSLLQKHGWQMGRTDSDQIEHWVRPGKPIDSGTSATWSAQANRGECAAQRFYVFSSNAAPLEAERSYTPFQLYQHLECQGEAQQAAKALSAAGWGTSDNPSPEVPPLEVLNLPALMSEEYRPLKWAVEPILPAGLSILAGRPKTGKSILALNLALSVAHGANAFQRDDLKVEAGSVLYCALEDSYRRLQSRLPGMLEQMGLPSSDKLDLAVHLHPLPLGLQQIENWLKRKPDARLVVVDVFARVKDHTSRSGTLYDMEYSSLGQVQQFAQQANLALLLIHHTRKSSAGQDPFDEFSGSTAITGAADTCLMLKLQPEGDAILQVKGRDVEEQEWALRFDTEHLVWSYTGPVIRRQAAPRQEEIIQLLRAVDSPLTVKSLSQSMDLKPNALHQSLYRMKEKGILHRPQRGTYQLTPNWMASRERKKRKEQPKVMLAPGFPPLHPTSEACKDLSKSKKEYNNINPLVDNVVGEQENKTSLTSKGKNQLPYTLPTGGCKEVEKEETSHSLKKEDENKILTPLKGEEGQALTREFKLVESEADLPAAIEDYRLAEVVAIDIETSGLDPRSDQIRLIQLAIPDQPPLIVDLFQVPSGLQRLDPVFTNPAIKVFHNAKFDLQFLQHNGVRLEGQIFDTMLADQLLSAGKANHSSSLENLAQSHLGRQLDKQQQSSQWEADLTQDQLAYAAADVGELLPLRRVLRKSLLAQGLTQVAQLEFDCLRSLAQMELAGFKLDVERWQQYGQWVKQQLLHYQDRLRHHFRDWPQQQEKPLNLNSTQQLQLALSSLGIEAHSTAKDKLEPLSEQPVIADLLQYKHWQSQDSKYVDKIRQAVHPESGRIHAQYFQLGADTGRLSCRKPPLQQIPRQPQVRSCFVAAAGHKLVSADYSQIELRVTAQISQDQRMIEAYRQGEDLHRLTATLITDTPIEEVTSDQRQAAKAVNFGLFFGMGAEGLRNYARNTFQVEMSLLQAKQFKQRFFHSYQGFSAYYQQKERSRVKQITTLSGRIRHFGPGCASLTKALNTPVQGTAADIIKRALVDLGPQLVDTRAQMVACVHDEIILEVEEEQALKAQQILQRVMVAAGQHYLTDVPVVVEAFMADSWAEK